jgi:hypothetical protein
MNLIEQMQKPNFYNHSVIQPIELIQTHVSYVFLTGEYAYKLKKPVNFGFLDFSTLEKRKHFLGEEKRMNEPIAPNLYLEVLPIALQQDNYLLNGEGEPVEYALKMRQFPQEHLFVNMFEKGELTEEHMEQLGVIVAKFHSQTETNEYITSFGEIAKIRESIDENYQQTSKYIGLAQTEAQYIQTKEFTDNFFSSREDIFQSRRDNLKIRECHGDLHLRNICLWENKIQLFDRIEFNEPFRFVDVMYDVAFAVMDLDARGYQNFGNAFLNTYLEQTGDWEGLQVLPVYLSRQAYVRAKVTSFLLDDPGIPSEAKEQARQTASAYYRLACEYTKPKQGRLILMSGLSGVGKSTVAKYLARQLNGIQIRSDALRKHLVGIPLESRGAQEIYSAAMSEKTYNRLLELGVMLAKQGFTVILDARYDLSKCRQQAIAEAKANNIALQIVSCTAPIEILRERLDSRQDISDATSSLLDSQQATTESFTDEELALVINIDTSKEDWRNSLSL